MASGQHQGGDECLLLAPSTVTVCGTRFGWFRDTEEVHASDQGETDVWFFT